MTATTTEVQAGAPQSTEKPLHYFWDVESYTNLYCCGFLDDNDYLEMFYRVNTPEDAEEVRRACEDSRFKYTMYDLSKDMSRFKWHFEQRIPRSPQPTLLSDFLGVEDKEVKPKVDFYFSYNGLQYDIPLCDHIINSSLSNRLQTTPESIRSHSDAIINRTARYTDTAPYEKYGNQVDCAYLNEKMIDKGRPTVGLKTLVGIKGGSIIESESNKSGYSKSIYADVLYNINDITELRDVVYPGVMETTFNNRSYLLANFPKLAQNGITVNSTSAKFVEYIVSPDKAIMDTPTVSFMYPAPHIAEKLGVPVTDVLEDTKNWYIENVYKRVAKNNKPAADAHLIKFMSIYAYYASVRGKNWNESALHAMTYGLPAEPKSNRRKLFNEYGTFLPFIDEYGNDSSTYANFSLGGIHGAEINHKQLKQDREKIKYLKETYGKISMIPKKEVSISLLNLIKIQSRTKYKDYPVHLSHEIAYLYHNTEQTDEIIDPEEFTAYMFDDGDKNKKEVLIKRYKYTSIGHSVHQDFAGYYPMLLINLGVFYDGHGIDHYEEVYNYRISVKTKLKTIPYGTKHWQLVNTEQEGYKLVLNSASGILDGDFDTNLRANNQAMAMRCIGQLFTFRIGMVLALEGAIIPSSNTDGIYVFNIDIDRNIELVNYELKQLYIQIDPEPVYLVSKDANNRMEMEDGKVISARGASLTSWNGANVDNRLAHPALVDKVLTLYLQHDNIVDAPVDKKLILQSLQQYHDKIDVLEVFKDYPDAEKRTFVYMASWVMRSTSGSIMIDDKNNIYPGTIRTWLTADGSILSRYGTRKTKPSPTLEDYSSKMFGNVKLGNPDTVRYLTDVGAYDLYFNDAITVDEYKEHRQETVDKNGKVQYVGESVPMIAETKISNLPQDKRVHINNASILKMSEEEVDEVYQRIDINSYVDMLAEFASKWHNVLVVS